MVLISSKNDKKGSEELHTDERVEEDPAGKGFVKRSGKVDHPLTNRTSLINGLTVAEQDPALKRPKTNGKKGKGNEKKVGGSSALLNK